MCPPSSEEVLFARTTIAIAFQRTIDRSRRSMLGSLGSVGSRSAGIVFTYAVFSEAIGPVPACWARSMTRVSSSRARSGPSVAMTASIASSHSVVSTASLSGAAASLPLPATSGSEGASPLAACPLLLGRAGLAVRSEVAMRREVRLYLRDRGHRDDASSESPHPGDRVTLREIDGPPGAPWDRPLAGALDRLTVTSEVLAGNPLGDPSRRRAPLRRR